MKNPYKIVSGASTPDTPDRRELADWLAKDGQLLIPLVELLEKGERAIDEVIDVMDRATIEAVLRMSAEQVAGPKEQGRRDADRDLSGLYVLVVDLDGIVFGDYHVLAAVGALQPTMRSSA